MQEKKKSGRSPKRGDGNDSAASSPGKSQANGQKKDDPVDNMYHILRQIVDALAEADKFEFFKRIQIKNETVPKDVVDLSVIQKKIENREYANVAQFQDDFDTVLLYAQYAYPADHKAREIIPKFHAFGTRLIADNITSIAESLRTAPAEQREEAIQEAMAHIRSNRGRKSDNSKETISFRGAKKSLVRKETDGTLSFSSVALRHMEDVETTGEITAVVVNPKRSLAENEVPRLRDALGPVDASHIASLSSESKENMAVKKVEFLDYGPFSSFAPTFSGSNATVSSFDTSYAARFKQFKKQALKEAIETNERHAENGLGATAMEMDEDTKKSLTESGVDVEHLEKMLVFEALTSENNKLFKELEKHQKQRLLSGRPDRVSELEGALVTKIRENLTRLYGEFASPSQLYEPEVLENAMQNVVRTEPAYKGTLKPMEIKPPQSLAGQAKVTGPATAPLPMSTPQLQAPPMATPTPSRPSPAMRPPANMPFNARPPMNMPFAPGMPNMPNMPGLGFAFPMGPMSNMMGMNPLAPTMPGLAGLGNVPLNMNLGNLNMAVGGMNMNMNMNMNMMNMNLMNLGMMNPLNPLASLQLGMPNMTMAPLPPGMMAPVNLQQGQPGIPMNLGQVRPTMPGSKPPNPPPQ